MKKSNYPKMLYKPEASTEEAEGFSISNEKIGFKSVKNFEQEQIARKSGWLFTLSEAESVLTRWEKRRALLNYCKTHIKFFITTLLAIVGLVIAYLSLVKS